jgi:hypothetical protein
MEKKKTGAAKEGQRESARGTRRQGEGGEKYYFCSSDGEEGRDVVAVASAIKEGSATNVIPGADISSKFSFRPHTTFKTLLRLY